MLISSRWPRPSKAMKTHRHARKLFPTVNCFLSFVTVEPASRDTGGAPVCSCGGDAACPGLGAATLGNADHCDVDVAVCYVAAGVCCPGACGAGTIARDTGL